MPSVRCSYGTCKSDKRFTKNVKFFCLPKLRIEKAKCERWVKACGRLDFTIKDVGSRYANHKPKTFYLCSNHFVGENGPSKSHPDPIPNLKMVTKINGIRKDIEGISVAHIPNSESLEAVKEISEDPTHAIKDPELVYIKKEIIDSDFDNTSYEDSSKFCIYQEKRIFEPMPLSDFEPKASSENLAHHLQPVELVPCKMEVPDSYFEKPSPEDSHNFHINQEMINDETEILPELRQSDFEPKETSENLKLIPCKMEVPDSNFEKPLSEDSYKFNIDQEVIDDQTESLPTLSDLERQVVCPPNWVKLLSPAKLELMKLGFDTTLVVLKLSIDHEFFTTVTVLNSPLDETNELNEIIPRVITECDELHRTLIKVDEWKICSGNSDNELLRDYQSKKSQFGYICQYTKGLKSNKCALIFNPTMTSNSFRCEYCQLFRYSVQKSFASNQNIQGQNDPKLEYKSLHRKELIKKVKESKKMERKLKRKIKSIKVKLNLIKEAVEVVYQDSDSA